MDAVKRDTSSSIVPKALAREVRLVERPEPDLVTTVEENTGTGNVPTCIRQTKEVKQGEERQDMEKGSLARQNIWGATERKLLPRAADRFSTEHKRLRNEAHFNSMVRISNTRTKKIIIERSRHRAKNVRAPVTRLRLKTPGLESERPI